MTKQTRQECKGLLLFVTRYMTLVYSINFGSCCILQSQYQQLLSFGPN